jgi:hypothetical protein
MTSYLTQQHRIEKNIRKEDNIIKSANSSGRYLPLKDTSTKTTALPIIPRINGKFTEIVKDKWSRRSMGQEKGRSNQEASLENLQSLRNAIREGKLEKVVPPPNGKHFPPLKDPFLNPSAANSSRSGSREDSRTRTAKAQKSTSKMATYISHSADILDQTRREIKGKFREPFEHLNYPSFSPSRRASNSSSDSFYCIGEGVEDQEANTKAVRELKAHYQEPKRLSDEGTSPLTLGDDEKIEKCRLCRNHLPNGVIGLCRECEKEFERPKTRVFGLEFDNNYSEEEEEEEMKPTPPLKDKKMFVARNDLKSRFNFEPGEMDEEKKPPAVPSKDEVDFARRDVRSRPVLERNPERQSSQKAQIEEQGYRYERYSNSNQQMTQKEMDEKTRHKLERWARCYGSGDFGNFDKREEHDNVTPLVEKKVGREKKKNAVSRRSSFYGFWDDVLGEPVSRR